MFAVSAMAALAACAHSPTSSPLNRQLPAAGAMFDRVPPPKIEAGQFPEQVAAACLVTLDQANGRLTDAGDWYEQIRSGFAGNGSAN